MQENLKNPPRYNRNKVAVWNFIIDNYLAYSVAMAVKCIFKYREHEPLKSMEKAWVYIDKSLKKIDIITTTYSQYAVENSRYAHENIKRGDFESLDDVQFDFIKKSLQTVTMNRAELQDVLCQMQEITENIIFGLLKGRLLHVEENGVVQRLLVQSMDKNNFYVQDEMGVKKILSKQQAIGYLTHFNKDSDLH